MIPIRAQVKDWMRRIDGQDFAALRLKYASNCDAMEAILQLECRKKAFSKLPKLLENEDFVFPTSLSAEQCTSELLAEFHAGLIGPNGSVLDMTCGLGVDAFYISRVSKSVLALDINPDVAAVANHNAEVLGITNFKAICADSSVSLQDFDSDSFDTIFIDPARRNNGKKVMFLNDCSPNVTDLLPKMLEVAKSIVIKASPMLDITATVKELGCVKDVYAIGTPTECKELTIVCERGYASTPDIHAVTLTKNGVLNCDFGDEVNYDVSFLDEIEVGAYLYEPYPAVMKTGLFDRIASRYSVSKLSHDTNIYLSNALCDKFPGRKMRILHASPYSKRSIRFVKENYPKANVTTRGFVLSAPQFAKNLGIVEGGELFVYGLGLNGKRNYWLAVCEVI